MLPLVASDHVDGLLDQVEVELLVAARRREIEIAVNESLRPCVEQGVDIGLVPSRLLDRLKLGIEII